VLVLHVGLPKTGSTSLQSGVFARADGVAYAHRKRGAAAADLTEGLRDYVRAGPVAAAFARRGLVRRLAAFAPEAATVLVSDENVALGQAEFWRGRGPAPADVARRLAALAGALPDRLRPVRVLVGVRRQDRWLASSFAHKAGDRAAARGEGLHDAADEEKPKARGEEAETDGLGWRELLPDRPAAEHHPQDGHAEVQRPQPRGAHRVDELQRRELGDHQRQDDRERRPDRRREHEEHQERHLPDGGKADEAVVGRLHPHVGEVDHAGQRDQERRQEPPGRGQEVGVDQRVGGDEHVGQVVDHEVEDRAVPVGGVALGVDPARQRAVDAVDDQREPEPAEHQPPLALRGGDQRHQRQRRAGAGQQVDGERQRLRLHDGQIRPSGPA
jgi:hypothetical protein